MKSYSDVVRYTESYIHLVWHKFKILTFCLVGFWEGPCQRGRRRREGGEECLSWLHFSLAAPLLVGEIPLFSDCREKKRKNNQQGYSH